MEERLDLAWGFLRYFLQSYPLCALHASMLTSSHSDAPRVVFFL